MKKVVSHIALVSFLFAGFAQGQIAKITFEDIRMKGDNIYANIITKEFYKSLKAYRLYRFYPQGVFLANDLSDTSNCLNGDTDTLGIFNNHIYHVYAPFTSHKISIIMIPNQESLLFFIGLNCCKPKHTLSDVLYWMHRQHDFDSAVFYRVKHYNSYYLGISMDISGCDCECLNQREHFLKRFRRPFKVNIQN